MNNYNQDVEWKRYVNAEEERELEALVVAGRTVQQVWLMTNQDTSAERARVSTTLEDFEEFWVTEKGFMEV
jgi:hypothetical protein